MSWGKNIFYCLLWSVYTVAVFFAIAAVGSTFCSGLDIPPYIGLLSAVVMAVLLGGVAFGLRWLSSGLETYFAERAGVRLAVEAALMIVFLTVGLVLRVKNLEIAEEAGVYYEIAEVSMDKSLPQMEHGAVYLYVWLLHVVFLFLGNNFVFGIILQAVLQCIAALSLFWLIRKHIGPLAALVMLGFFSAAPYMIRAGLTLSPDMLYLCLWSAAAAIAVKCGRSRKPVLFLYAGVVSSMLFYLDASGVILLLLSLWMAVHTRSAKVVHRKRKMAAVLCCGAGFGLGFTGCLLGDAYVRGKTAGEVLRAWILLYQPKRFQMPVIVEEFDSGREELVLLGLLILGVYSFWFSTKRERMAACMLTVCAMALAICFGIFTAEMPGTLFLYLFIVLMAGIAVEQCFGRRALELNLDKEPPQEEIDSQDQIAGEEEMPAQRQETVPVSAGVVSSGPASSETGEKKESSADEKAGTPKQEIKYIENPLPLPKKHVKKTLDYDFPVAEDDDFDF